MLQEGGPEVKPLGLNSFQQRENLTACAAKETVCRVQLSSLSPKE